MAKIFKASNWRDEEVIVVRATYDSDYSTNRDTFTPEVSIAIEGKSASLNEKETLTLVSTLTKAMEEARVRAAKRQASYDKRVEAKAAKVAKADA